MHLKGLTSLKELRLVGFVRISDAGLVHLKGMTNLQNLQLLETRITDAGLVHLEALTNLQKLHLSFTQVTDAGLVHTVGSVKWICKERVVVSHAPEAFRV